MSGTHIRRLDGRIQRIEHPLTVHVTFAHGAREALVYEERPGLFDELLKACERGLARYSSARRYAWPMTVDGRLPRFDFADVVYADVEVDDPTRPKEDGHGPDEPRPA